MNRRRNSAMTLIELLVAAAVLSLALIPVADLLLKNTRQTQFSGDRLFAAMRARMVLERFRCLPALELAQRFPVDGSGSFALANDPYLSVPGTTPTSVMPLAKALEDEERMRAQQRDVRFPAELRFVPASSGLSGQLVAKVTWTPVNGKKSTSLTASEWITERTSPDAIR